MEYTTCEGYVLAELESAQREAERLRGRVAELEEAAGPGEPGMDAYCLGVGRRKVAEDAVNAWRYGAVRDGAAVPYGEWVENVVRGGDVPPFATKGEFLAYLRPQLEDIYGEELSRRGEGAARC